MADEIGASSWGATATQIEPEILLESVSCPGCSETAFESILSASDHLTRLGGKFMLVRCKKCSLVLTNPRPAMQSLGYFYPNDYSPYNACEVQGSNWWLRLLERSALRSHFGYPKQPVSLATRLLGQLGMKRFSTRRKRHDWIPFRGEGNLLDVGCGSGGFMDRMRSFGWNVRGLEMAPDVAQRVEDRTGIRVHAGTLPHAELRTKRFDAITLWHVLEHVPNPRELLNYAVELLNPHGLLVVEVPNIESETFARFGPHWYGLELPRHFQHFSPNTLAEMLPANAFCKVEIQQIGFRSLIKCSAERAVKAGCIEYLDWLTKPKSFWTELANRTEANSRADVIRLIAERN